MLPLSLALVRTPGFPKDLRVLLSLISLNIEHHARLSAKFHPNYARRISPLVRLWDKHVGWRVNPWISD
jgi:hypothetical protein